MSTKGLITLCLFLPTLASAQVYKCVQNGKTVYSGSPCGANAQPVHAGEESAAEKQRLRDAAEARQRGAEAIGAAVAQARSDKSPAPAGINNTGSRPQSKREYCDNLLKTAKAAKDEAATYRYHQGLIDDAKRRQKEAEDEHFSRCYGSNF